MSKVKLVREQQDNRSDLLTVVIHIRDRWGPRVRNCFRSLELQTVKEFDIIVSDYGSTLVNHKKLLETLKPFDCTIYYYPTDEIWSRPVASNIGIRRSKTKFVATLDVDVMLEIKVLETTLECFEKNPDSFVISTVCSLPNKGVNFLNKIKLPEDYEEFRRICRYKWSCTGVFASALRDWWFKVRGYDERMKVWGSADTDIRDRARKSISLVYLQSLSLPETMFFHQWHPLSRDVWQEKIGEKEFYRHNSRNKYFRFHSSSIIRNDENWGVM